MQLKSLVEISNFQIVELLKSVVQGESCYNFQRILLAGDGPGAADILSRLCHI